MPVAAAQVSVGSPTVLVTVLAPKAPVTDLTAKDFKITAGGAPIEVTAADHATDPLWIEILADNAQPPIGVTAPTRDLRSALQAFAKAIRAGNPDAKIGLFTVGGPATEVVKNTASASDLDNAINHVAPGPSTNGSVLEGLVVAARALMTADAPRRAIVSIDFASPDEASDAVLQNIETSVFQSGATVWAVSVAGTTPETPSRDAVLNDLAKATGGQRETINASSALQYQLKVIANSLLSQYVVRLGQSVADVKSLKIETPKGKAFVSNFKR
jgi:hypothetical protein